MTSFIQFNKKKFRRNKKFVLKPLIIGVFLVGIILALSYNFSGFDSGTKTTYEPANVLHVNRSFEGEILFNDIDGYEKYSQVALSAVQSAKYSIQIAAYSFRSDALVKALQAKVEEGVDVQVVLPESKSKQHRLVFGLTDIPTVSIGKTGEEDSEIIGDLMHNKFILIDPETSNQQLIFGSSNFTFLQEKYDPSFLMRTKDTSTINVFLNEFELLKSNIHGIKKISSGKYRPFAQKVFYTNGFIETWFSPGYNKNSLKYRIIDEIQSAQTSIKIIGWRINDFDIYSALAKKAREGIEVRVLSDDYYMWDEYSITDDLNVLSKNINENLLSFSDSYMHIRLLKGLFGTGDNLSNKFNSFMHHHALIVDDTILVTGSNNWSSNGFYYNDESAIVTSVEQLVGAYVKYFEYATDLLQGQKLEMTLNTDNTLVIKSVPKNTTKIIVYIEKSFPDWTGDVCLESDFTSTDSKVKIPQECITPTTRIFLTDNGYKLQGSAYLK